MYDQDFFRFTDMLDWDKQGDDEEFKNPVDLMFEELEERDRVL
jgi:hypothetical protein